MVLKPQEELWLWVKAGQQQALWPTMEGQTLSRPVTHEGADRTHPQALPLLDFLRVSPCNLKPEGREAQVQSLERSLSGRAGRERWRRNLENRTQGHPAPMGKAKAHLPHSILGGSHFVHLHDIFDCHDTVGVHCRTPLQSLKGQTPHVSIS